MIIVDASALIAICFDEPDAEQFATALANANERRISAVNYLEAAIRIDREDSTITSQKFEALIKHLKIRIEPVTAEQTHLARTAYAQYGKGVHPAALNFGDCFAYALSKHTRMPLLFKGNDFSQTDIVGVFV